MCGEILNFVEPRKFIRETNENKRKAPMRRERWLSEKREMTDIK